MSTIRVFLELVAQGYTDEMRRAAESNRTLSESLLDIVAPASNTSGVLGGLKGELLSLAAAYVSISAASNFFNDLVETNAAAQQLNTRLQELTGSAWAFGETVEYITETSQKMSLDITAFGDSYSKLLVLQQSGLMTTTEARQIMEGYSNAMAALGVESQQVKQSLYGFAQGLSAGTLRAEELNQITEAMPGLMQKLDQAVGGVGGSFRNMVLEGNVSSQMLRETMIKALGEFDGAAERTANNIGPTMTRVSNTYNGFKTSLEKPVNALILPILEEAGRLLGIFTKYAKENEAALIEMATNAAGMIKSLMSAVADLVIMFVEGGRAVAQFVTENQGLITTAAQVVVGFVLIKSAVVLLLTTIVGFSAAITSITAFAGAVGAAAMAMTGATTVMAALTMGIRAATAAAMAFAVTPLGAVLLLAAVAAVGVGIALSSTNEALAETGAETKEVQKEITLFADAISELRRIGDFAEPLVAEVEKVKAAFQEGLIDEATAKKQIDGIMQIAQERVSKELALETDLKSKKKELEEAHKKFEIDSTKQLLKEKEQALKSAESDYESHLKKLNQLKQNYVSWEQAAEDQLRELRRKGMTEVGAEGDKIVEFFDKMRAAREARDRGDMESAQKLTENAQKIALEVGNIGEVVDRLGGSKLAGERQMAETIKKMWQDDSAAMGLKKNYDDYRTSLEMQLALAEASTQQMRDLKKGEIEDQRATTEESLELMTSISGEVEGLKNKLKELGVPQKVTVESDVSKVEQDLKRIEQELEALRKTAISVGGEISNISPGGGGAEFVGFSHGGIVGGFSEGGLLPGYGGGDRRLAMLEDGEGILNKDSTRQFKDLFLLMNYKPNLAKELLAPIMGYSGGGLVGEFVSRFDIPHFSEGGIMQSAPAAHDTSSGNMQVFRLEIASKSGGGGVTLMGESQEIARLATILRRLS